MQINITLLGGEHHRMFLLSGRTGQTIDALIRAKKTGSTSVENPSLRLAASIHSLRELGFTIDTEMEQHGGDYPGYHARYWLRSTVILGHQHGEAALHG